MQDRAVAFDIDIVAKSVTFASGANVHYERLIVAPVIGFFEGSWPSWDVSS